MPGSGPPPGRSAGPSTARMYDYYLGGKDNFAVDRKAADAVIDIAAEAVTAAKANRKFLAAAVRHLAEQGIDQFIDIGAGIPTSPNVHEVAQQAQPGARVVYVDNDPVVLAHTRAQLGARGARRRAVQRAPRHRARDRTHARTGHRSARAVESGPANTGR